MRIQRRWGLAAAWAVLLGAGAFSSPAFAAPGNLQGAPIVLDNPEAEPQAKVARAPDGRFVALWHSNGADGFDQLTMRSFAANGTPATPALTVHAFTEQDQYGGAHDAAISAYQGGFVVVWTDNPASGDRTLFAQRFGFDGSAQGQAITLTQITGSCIDSPAVAINAGGDFAVSWHSATEGGNNTSCYGGKSAQLHAQSFRADGSALSQPVLVYSGTASAGYSFGYGCIPNSLLPCLLTGRFVNVRSASAIGIDGAGNFVVTWVHDYAFGLCPLDVCGNANSGEGADVLARRYRADGKPENLFTRVAHTSSYYWITTPSLAMAADGSWVVTWRAGQDEASNNPQMTVYAQRYGSNGAASGGSITVGTAKQIDPVFHVPPSVAMTDDGSFAIAWSDYVGGSAWDVVRTRFYGANGTPLSNAVDVAQVPCWDPDPGIAVDAQGNAVLAYNLGDAGDVVQLLQGP